MWRRAAAFLIDLIPLAMIAVVQNLPEFPDYEVVGFISLVLLVAYFAGMDYLYGGTVGKRIVGLRIALPNSPGVGYQLMLRALVKIVCIFPPMQTVYALVAIWRKDGRSLADFGTGSTVVDVLSLSPPEPASFVEQVVASMLVIVAPIIALLIFMMVCATLFGQMVVQ
jgi:uncharacterized RDD family membrane protein YckC